MMTVYDYKLWWNSLPRTEAEAIREQARQIANLIVYDKGTEKALQRLAYGQKQQLLMDYPELTGQMLERVISEELYKIIKE